MEPSAPAGLYLHLPFCFHLCHYCDFFSVVAPAGKEAAHQEAFTDALLQEIAEAAVVHRLRPSTVFVGGGTPTLLRVDLWSRLLDGLDAAGVLDDVSEFTVEANPETVTADLLATLRAGGVNRLSVGAQTFDAGGLATLERHHDPRNVARTMKLARDAGFDNLSLDLIFGIPGQTLAGVDADLAAALSLEPEHLSVYGLTYEPNTQLTARLRSGRVRRVDEDTEAAMYGLVMDRLTDAGFRQYELSNFARLGAGRDLRCRHNLLYWANGDWLGLGPAAASHLDGHRFRNVPNLKRYLAGAPRPPTEGHERLEPAERVGERLMLALRTDTGAPPGLLAEVSLQQREHLDQMTDLGFLKETAGHLCLTRRGKLVADSVVAGVL